MAAIVICNFAVAQLPLLDTTYFGEAVTITATKTLTKQSQTGKVITVIDKAMLENNSGKTVAEILSQQAGLFVAGAYNTAGSNQDVYMGGSGKLLFLLNGVPLYDASTIGNTFDINSITTQSLSRIEILRGAQSTLYGSDAIAGVINLITTVPTSKQFEGYVSVQAGSYNTYNTSIGINGTTDGTTYNVQLSHHNTNGISAAYDSTGTNNYDNDGFRQNAFNGTISGLVLPKLLVGVTTQISGYKAAVDYGAYSDDKDYTLNNENFTTALNANYATTKGKLYYTLSYNSTSRNYLNNDKDVNPAAFSTYEQQSYVGNSLFTELYTNQNVSKNIEIIGGVDYRDLNTTQNYLSKSAYGNYSTSISKDSVRQYMKSIFASLLIHTNKGFNMELGSRYNQHSTYGNNTTYTINPSYNYKQYKVFANISSAYKVPSLYQLYGPGVANSTLKAEESNTYEVGVQLATNKYTARGLYFNRNIKNGIDYNLNTFAYFNNNVQTDNGVQLEAQWQYKKINIATNYTYVTGSVNTKKYTYNPTSYSYDVKGDTTYNNLYRRPKSSLNTTITYKPNTHIIASTTLRNIGTRYEGQFEAMPVLLTAYYTLDAYIAYICTNKNRIFANFNNITNQQYFDVLGYNTRGYNFVAGIQIKF